MLWVKVGYARGMRPLVVGLWWLGCWGGGHRRGWVGFGCSFMVGSDRGYWGGGFWLRFCDSFVVGFGCSFVVGIGCGLCRGFFFFFGSWGLRLWLVVVVVAVAIVRGDELEKLWPWRF